MLEPTGKDLGKAESMQFCSAVVSRQMVEVDPSFIVDCPYIIVIHSLPQVPKTIYVG